MAGKDVAFEEAVDGEEAKPEEEAAWAPPPAASRRTARRHTSIHDFKRMTLLNASGGDSEASSASPSRPLSRQSSKRATSRMGSKRTLDLESMLMPPASVAESYSGVLLDFYARAQASSNIISKPGVDVLDGMLKDKLLLGNAPAESRLQMVADDAGTYHYASLLIDRDSLHYNLLRDLTKFWKKEGSKTWAPFGKDTVRALGWEIVRNKRLEASLRAEVGYWLSSHSQAAKPLREPEETLHERQARVRGFWDEYQTSFRRLEVPLGKSRAVSASNLHAGGTRGASKVSQNPWLNMTLPGSDDEDSPTSGLGGGMLARSSTRSQAKLQRCQSAGSVQKTPGLASMLPTMSICSNDSGAKLPMQTIYPRLVPVKVPPTIFKDTRLPPWAPPKSDPLPPRGKVLQVDRKAVLPPIADKDARVKDPLSKRYQRENRAKGPVAHPVKQFPSGGGSHSPTRRYVLECETNGIMPTPMPFITGHSLNFHLWDKVLVDNDLVAATVALPSMEQIEEADLEGNRVLTDKSLVPFLKKLASHPAIYSLQKLSLKYCVQAGKGTLDSVASLLSAEDGAVNLRYLNLGGMSISTKVQKKLCEAIMVHPALKSVHLADVGLGASASTRECVGCLLASRSIEILDLGWNCFSAEVFHDLGQRIVETRRLQSLSLANCSEAHNKAGDVPILYFLEFLGSDSTLTHLDVSLNRLNFCGGLMLEDTLQSHRQLAQLHVSHNPLGVFGLRNLLRLLLRKNSGLLHFYCDGCTNGPTTDAADIEPQIFNMNNPGGRYNLDLQRPYHRAILRMLYKTMEHFGCTPDVAFQEISFSAPPWVHPAKDQRGNWLVPNFGKLSVTFSLEKSMEAGLRKVNENSEFREVVEEHYRLTRLPPPFRKVIPLLALWRRLDGHSLEQTVILDALSKDFRLTFPQIVQLCESRSVTGEVIRRLLHCVVGGTPSRYLVLLEASSLGEFIKNHKGVVNYLSFNVDNPTGHYKLRLYNPSDHSVAEQLLLLDRWEAGLAKRKGRFPVSQRGNHTQIRNACHQNRKLNVQSIDQWKMPEFDMFEFDYVSGRRPSSTAKELDKMTFDSFMASLHASECSPDEVTLVLRMVSSHMYCTSMQLRGLLGIFSQDNDRADVFVLFFMRIVDMHNEKVFRVRFADKPDELVKLRRRLGATTLFPFIQPEQSQFELNMSVHDERLCAALIIDLASKESPLMNMRNPCFIHEDGTRDPLTTGVPRSWATFEKCPQGGTFKVQYECSPEDRCFDYRKKLMETYGFWSCRKAEDEVKWWAALAEAPSDVLEFLEFLVSRFDDIYQPFKVIDGTDGNGQISLREFEDGVRTLKCNKFKGRGEKERVANVFRYLDPSGEGQVSKGEWGILNSLWQEMRQSILEFVQFLERTFSYAPEQDRLNAAWDFIDEDESGEIDEKEWGAVVREGLKYFGPSHIIFHFLDKDDEGSVSMEEFETLEVFRTHLREEAQANKASLQPS